MAGVPNLAASECGESCLGAVGLLSLLDCAKAPSSALFVFHGILARRFEGNYAVFKGLSACRSRNHLGIGIILGRFLLQGGVMFGVLVGVAVTVAFLEVKYAFFLLRRLFLRLGRLKVDDVARQDLCGDRVVPLVTMPTVVWLTANEICSVSDCIPVLTVTFGCFRGSGGLRQFLGGDAGKAVVKLGGRILLHHANLVALATHALFHVAEVGTAEQATHGSLVKDNPLRPHFWLCTFLHNTIFAFRVPQLLYGEDFSQSLP